MEDNKIDNIQNTPIVQNVPVEQSTPIVQNVPVEQNKPIIKTDAKKKKTILFILVGILVLLMIIFVIIGLFILPKKNAKIILSDLGIDDYFKYVLTTDYKKDTNLLDINNEKQMFMYYYYNKNTKIYKIDFQDPTYEGNLFLTYAKYNDYMKYHEEVFGVKSKHEMSLYDIDIVDLKEVGNDVYHVVNAGPIQCQYSENTNNCYIKLTKDIKTSGEPEISDINIKDNVITGVVKFNSKTEYFEFTFEEKNNKKIIKTLKIIDSIE